LAATGVIEPGKPELLGAEPDEPEPELPEPEPELPAPEPELSELEPEPELSAAAQQLIAQQLRQQLRQLQLAVADEADEPEPELSEPKVSEAAEQLAALMAVPMAEWSEEQVLAWAELVELEPEARTALLIAFEDDGDTDGQELVAMTAKRLQKMLKKADLDGDPEAAAEAVLALRDALLATAMAAVPSLHAHLSAGQHEQQHTAEAAATAAAAVEAAKTIAVAEAVVKAQEAAAKAAASCQICFEPYGGGVVPRMLVACGHTFCEECLSKMLRCAPSTSSCVHRSACIEPPHARANQATATEERPEANGVPEVPHEVLRQGRAGGRAADQLRRHGHLSSYGRWALFVVERCSHAPLVVGFCCGHACFVVSVVGLWQYDLRPYVMLSFLWSTHDNDTSTFPQSVGLHCIVFQTVECYDKTVLACLEARCGMHSPSISEVELLQPRQRPSPQHPSRWRVRSLSHAARE
jgi:hypothetical protein